MTSSLFSQTRNRLFGVFVDPNREPRTKDQNASAAHYRVVVVDMEHPGLLHIIAGLLAFCSMLVVICTSLKLVLDMWVCWERFSKCNIQMFLYYIVEGDLSTSQLQGGGEYCEDWLIGIMGREVIEVANEGGSSHVCEVTKNNPSIVSNGDSPGWKLPIYM